jgi:hypothetical protein
MLDIATAAFSLFAFGETRELLKDIAGCRLVIPTRPDSEPQLFGSDADRPFRNRLNTIVQPALIARFSSASSKGRASGSVLTSPAQQHSMESWHQSISR